ncbi:MAG: hypothetical protein JOY58_00480 [Solirubrobacterales bacterium]|nr:hypothetical protein [Solirubrobacterales bacterium]
MNRAPRVPPAALAALATLAVAACGSSGSSSSSTTARTSSSQSAATQTSAGLPPAVNELAAAERPSTGTFPSPHGRSLQQLARLATASAQFGAATGTFTPGSRRVAFALTASSGAYIYAPTALYIGKGPNSAAEGPFLAPADPMSVAPQYRSEQNSGPGGIQAIYHTNVHLQSAGTYTVLALTKTPKGLVGSPGEVAVAPSSQIPDVGQRAPDIATDTVASVHGNTALLTTRIPPEDMHQVSFEQVLGKRPIALLFSTPQLCTSRVCGPVTDIAVQFQHQYQSRIAFIHEEVYVNNQPSQGLRPQLKAFRLETEPWLFTINRQGIIAARLEGAFGRNEFRQALQAALQ